MSDKRKTSLAVLLGIVMLAFVAIILGANITTANRQAEYQEQVSQLKVRVVDLNHEKASLTRENLKLKRELRFYQDAYRVTYKSVMTELGKLAEREASAEEIPFTDVKSVIIDIQHVYSVLSVEQGDKLALAMNNLYFGTKLMDAYPATQSEQVWKMIGNIQWREGLGE